MSPLAEQIARIIRTQVQPVMGHGALGLVNVSVDRATDAIIALLPLQGEGEVVEALLKALEPFAKFRLDGFDEYGVLEVVPASPDNPARRIEPIGAINFRRAAEAYAKGKGEA